MIITPGGATMADFDPNGVGAVRFLGGNFSDIPAPGKIESGDIVSAAELSLKGAAVVAGSTQDNFVLAMSNVPGHWMCLGHVENKTGTSQYFATLFMRVS